MSRIGNFILTATALAPVALIYGMIALVEKQWVLAGVLLLVAPVMLGLFYALLSAARRRIEIDDYEFSTIEPADRETFGILAMYLLPLLKSTVTGLPVTFILPAVVLFFALALTGHNFHFNPLLSLAKWNVYRARTTGGVAYLLITKDNIKSLAKRVPAIQLTEYTLIDPGGKTSPEDAET